MYGTSDYNGLSPSQKKAFEHALVGDSALVSGVALTGKSFLKTIIKRHMPHMLCVSAHPFLGAERRLEQLSIREFMGNFILANNADVVKFSLRLRDLTCILIDDAHFLRSDQIDLLDQALRKVNYSNLPFGGIQTVMLYDPAIVLSHAWLGRDLLGWLEQHYPDGFHFSTAHALKDGILRIDLSHDDRVIDRKEQMLITELSKKALECRLPSATIEVLKSHINHINTGPYFCTNAQHSLMLNMKALDKLPGQMFESISVYRSSPTVKTFPESIHIKNNCKILFTRNVHEYGVLAGEAATVKYVGRNFVELITDDHRDIKMKKKEIPIYQWESTAKGWVLSEVNYCEQWPFVLCYAFSSRKSLDVRFTSVNFSIQLLQNPMSMYLSTKNVETLSASNITSDF